MWRAGQGEDDAAARLPQSPMQRKIALATVLSMRAIGLTARQGTNHAWASMQEHLDPCAALPELSIAPIGWATQYRAALAPSS